MMSQPDQVPFHETNERRHRRVRVGDWWEYGEGGTEVEDAVTTFSLAESAC